jgi:hypothetical protein
MTNIVQTLTDIAHSLAVNSARYAAQQSDGRESLSEFSNDTRLSATSLIEGGLVRQLGPNLQSINQLQLGLYTGFYLAAVNRINKIGNITVSRMLSPLSDKPSFVDAIEGAYETNQAIRANNSASMNIGVDFEVDGKKVKLSAFDMSKDYTINCTKVKDISMESLKPNDLASPTNLAVGKLIEVELVNGNTRLVVKVTLTLKPTVVNESLMTDILEAYIGKDQSFMGRLHRYRAGMFRSFAEYALGLDLLESDRRVKIKSGNDDQFNLNRLESTASGLVLGNKQFNIASSMIVVSTDKVREIERAMRGKLSNDSERHKFFVVTGSMVLIIVDVMRESIILYQRGIDGFGLFTFEDIKPMGEKANGIDFADVMKSWTAGKSFNI